MSPSQYSSTLLPRGFTVPMPVTTTRSGSRLMAGGRLPISRVASPSPSQRLPNLTHEIVFNRLPGDANRVLHGSSVRAPVGDDRTALDAEKGGTAELAPVHAGPDATDPAPDQQATGLPGQCSRNLVTHGPEDQVRRRLSHLDGNVAHKAVGDHDVRSTGQHLFWLDVADEVDLPIAALEPGGRSSYLLVPLPLLLAVAQERDGRIGAAEDLLGVDRTHPSELHEEFRAGVDVGAHIQEVGWLASRWQDGPERRSVDAANAALNEKRRRHDGARIARGNPGRDFVVVGQRCAHAYRGVSLRADRLRRVITHFDHLARGDEAQLWMGVEQALNPVGHADHHDLDAQVASRFGGAEHDLLRGEVATHAVDRDAYRRCAQGQLI